MGEANNRETFEERKQEAITEKGAVRIRFSGAVFTHFFEVSKRAFGINIGLPEGSELVDITYDKAIKEGVATFWHESFAEVSEGGDPPYINVQYTAYEIVPAPAPEGDKQ